MKKNIFHSMMLVLALLLLLTVTFIQPSTVAAADPLPIRAYICITGSDSSQLAPGTSYYQNPPTGSIAYFGQGTENGCKYHDFPAGTTNVKVWTTYNNTTSQQLTQDISVNPTFNFNTNKLTLKLTKCDGAPLIGGTARWKIGGTTYFFPAPNSTGADGKTSAEVFPGTYDFEMRYNATTEWKYSQVIPDADHEILWKTTLVTLAWPGQISYGGSAGDSGWFNKPSMEMMPGTVKFHFRPVGSHPGYTTDLTFSGCIYTGGFLTLVNEAGSPLANYPADYPTETRNLKWKYRCGGSWGPETSFKTNANGQTFYSIGCSNWDKKITVTLNQTAKEQDVTVNSTFQAAKVVTELRNHVGSLITDVPSGTVDQGGGYWYKHGTTGPTGQAIFYAFPGTIKLRMSYNHASPEVYPAIVAGTNTVVFQTGQLKLWFSGSIRSNAGGSWWNPTNGMELLPGNYNMCFSGPGHPESCVLVTVNAGSVAEKTVAYIRLKNSNGTPQLNYTASWVRYGAPPEQSVAGTPDANGVLLNLMDGYNNTYYAYHWVTYLNAKSYTPLAQVPASNSFYDLQLTRVEVQLKDHAGNLMTGTGPDVYFYTYYSGQAGRRLFGTLNNGTVSKDLLQGYRHYFDIDYNGTYKQVWQDNLTTPVVFQTFLVLDNGWGCTNYSQYGKPAYGQTFPASGQVELLPGYRTYYKNNVGATQWFDVLVGGKTLDLSTGSITP